MRILFSVLLLMAVFLSLDAQKKYEQNVSPHPWGISGQLTSLGGITLDRMVGNRAMLVVGGFYFGGPTYSVGTKFFVTNPNKQMWNWYVGYRYAQGFHDLNIPIQIHYLPIGLYGFLINNWQFSLNIGPALIKWNPEEIYDENNGQVIGYEDSDFELWPNLGLKVGYRFGTNKKSEYRNSYLNERKQLKNTQEPIENAESNIVRENLNPFDSIKVLSDNDEIKKAQEDHAKNMHRMQAYAFQRSGLSLNVYGASMILGLSLDFFVQDYVALEFGLGLLSVSAGTKFFITNPTKQAHNFFIGYQFTAFALPLVDSGIFHYIPVGYRFFGNNRIQLGLEAGPAWFKYQYESIEKEPTFYGGIKVGYRFGKELR